MKANHNLAFALFGLLAAVPLISQPAITAQPADQSVSLGATVQFRVAATTSGGAATCRWWFKDAALDPEPNPSAATRTLVLTNTTAAMAGPYWAVLSDDNGSATSETAQLVVDRTFRKVTEGVVVTDKESSTSATWCDYDRDGLPDLFVGNFWWPNPQRLSMYHKEGGGFFTKVTNAITTASNVSLDLLWGDFDNDGDPDLFVSRPERRNGHFRNDGQGAFVAVTNAVTQTSARHLGAAWADLGRDGWLDLFISTYNLTGAGADQDNDFVFRNTGSDFASLAADAVGALVMDAADTAYPSWCDFDNDGDADLYLGGRGSSFLYRNDGNGQFESIGLGSVPPSGPSLGGCWADVNNDGLFDLYVFGTGGLPLTLHLNRAGQTFEDVTDAAGLGLSGSVWGPAFGDYDNDGDLDLFVPDYRSRNTFFANNGDGTFRSLNVGSPLTDGLHDEAASWVDFDNDGFLDLFVPCGEGSPSPNLLYHNNLPLDGNTNRWL